jgi:hypothetical protein
MLKVVYPALKKANPKAFVVMGALACGDPTEWIRGVYEEGGRDYFDIMSMDTYGVPVWWAVAARNYAAKVAMGEYGDFDRPLWVTEFGTCAGTLWAAWKIKTAEEYDRLHLEMWQKSIELLLEKRLVSVMMPYGYHCENEGDFDLEAAGVTLPEGHTLHDYGFGMVRADGITPRPTYKWLEEAQINADIQARPVIKTDVAMKWDGSWEPMGYEYDLGSAMDKVIIKEVSIDSALPTIIKLKSRVIPRPNYRGE